MNANWIFMLEYGLFLILITIEHWRHKMFCMLEHEQLEQLDVIHQSLKLFNNF